MKNVTDKLRQRVARPGSSPRTDTANLFEADKAATARQAARDKERAMRLYDCIISEVPHGGIIAREGNLIAAKF